ncbi:MAG: CoA-transferase [Candidatus Heteroscillospira sp.]|jgi:acetate CoA/acetoacetate CoA-transferase beta subunit
MDIRKFIAKNIAAMLHDGDFVNLGVGIPTLVSDYIPKNMTVLLHGENGSVGAAALVTIAPNEIDTWKATACGENGDWRTGHRDLANASGEYITIIPGGCCFDSSTSFAMARGGHLDATVLGGLQVDADANLANWTIPGKRTTGMGGAMDLVSGAKRVIVAMEHCTKTGEAKLVKKCTMPLTAVACVSAVVTELCVMEYIDGKFVVTAMAPGVTRDELISKTEIDLVFSGNVRTMDPV